MFVYNFTYSQAFAYRKVLNSTSINFSNVHKVECQNFNYTITLGIKILLTSEQFFLIAVGEMLLTFHKSCYQQCYLW